MIKRLFLKFKNSVFEFFNENGVLVGSLYVLIFVLYLPFVLPVSLISSFNELSKDWFKKKKR